MNRFRKFSRYRLRTLLLLTAFVSAGVWWFAVRPRESARRQMLAGRSRIHQRDRVYLDFVFDETVKKHLVTVLGDSRLTHWDDVTWIVCIDRQTIVSYGSDQALLVWNRDDGSIRQGFYDIHAAAYASQTQQFFVLTADGNLKTWTPGQPPRVDPQAPPSPLKIGRLTCSGDGRFLAYVQTSPQGAATNIWDRQAGKNVLTLPKAYYPITFSPDSKQVLLVKLFKINEYEIATGKLLGAHETPPDAASNVRISVMRFSEDGRHLYVADATGRILVYDWLKKRLLRNIGTNRGTINDLAIYHQQTHILAASQQLRTYATWGAPDKITSSTVLTKSVTAVYAGPNGIAAAIRGGRLIEPNGDTLRRLKGGPRMDATCFAFSPSGDRIALAGRDGQIVIRDTRDWNRVQSWRGHEGWIRRLKWSPRGDMLLSLAEDNNLVAWDDSGHELFATQAFANFEHRMGAFDREGKRFAHDGVACGAMGIHLFDLDTFGAQHSIPHSALRIRGNILFSHDGRMLYVGGGGRKMVGVFSLQNNKLVQSFGRKTYDEVKLALSPDQSRIFAIDVRSAFAFDTITGKQLWTAKVHRDLVFDISSHPTLPLLATSGGDGKVVLVDTDTGRILHRLRLGPAQGDVLQVEFSPDGQLMAAAMSNGAVVVMRIP